MYSWLKDKTKWRTQKPNHAMLQLTVMSFHSPHHQLFDAVGKAVPPGRSLAITETMIGILTNLKWLTPAVVRKHRAEGGGERIVQGDGGKTGENPGEIQVKSAPFSFSLGMKLKKTNNKKQKLTC